MSQLSLQNKYTLPFEGGKHKGTIIELPYRRDTWRLNAVPAISVFKEIVSIISKYENVYLLVDLSIDDSVCNQFIMNNVFIIRCKYNDSWARDNTLLFMSNGKNIKAVDYGFNAWGGSVDGLYPYYLDDNNLGKFLIDYFKCDSISKKDFILEGGSIHSDGEGCLITTEACLLSKGRNSSLTKDEIELELKNTLGIDKVLWIPHGIYNDETNEHVDNVCCFLAPGVVALASCEDENDIQYQYYMEAYNYLSNATDSKGRKLEIVNIPVPKTLYMTSEEAKGLEISDAIERPENNRLAGSYINFYMSDKFVLVPQFGVEEDEIALNILKKYYPNKDVYGIKSREILLAGGNIHCVTMQVPMED